LLGGPDRGEVGREFWEEGEEVRKREKKKKKKKESCDCLNGGECQKNQALFNGLIGNYYNLVSFSLLFTFP
jgi:hypothetical protein